MARTQFSLRTLFAAVAVVGIGAALWVAEPSWQLGAIEALVLAWVPGSAVALAVHSVGKTKTFWIGFAAESIWPVLAYLPIIVGLSLHVIVLDETGVGGIPPSETLSVWFPRLLIGISHTLRPVLIAWAFAPVVGLLCVLTHWLLVRPASAEPKD